MTDDLSSSKEKRCIFLANWSGYPSLESTQAQLEKLRAQMNFYLAASYIAFPFATCLTLREKYPDSPLILGVEGMLNTQEGSFTEPIAARLLAESKIPFVIIDKTATQANPQLLTKQIPKLLQYNVKPFICFGESLVDYQKGNSKAVLSAWISELIKAISPHLLMNIHLVYDPDWIHLLPSKPTLEQLVEAYQKCREILQDHAGIQMGKEIPLICSFPYDLEDLSTAKSQSLINGFYFNKAGLNQSKIHNFFVNYKEPIIEPQPIETATNITEPAISIDRPSEIKEPEIPKPEESQPEAAEPVVPDTEESQAEDTKPEVPETKESQAENTEPEVSDKGLQEDDSTR